ncbi:MAG: ABC transporter substrate-binding protein [Clostridiales bacterium]|nr:ABC transporter substrate-binding protein [Clostridiales bacterium]
MKNLHCKVLVFVLALTLVLVVAATALAANPKYGDTFMVGIGSDPQTLNGSISSSYFDKIVASNIFSMLIRLDYSMNPVPDLAEKWTISDDGLTYTFNLRSGVKWHDGKPFSSVDVKFTMEEIILQHHPRSNTFDGAIDRVETPDADTVVFHLKKPYGPFMNLLGYDFFILPKHLYENTDIKNNPHNNEPVGTGPFIFEEWSHGSHIAFRRNPDYFQKGLPYLDRLVFRVIPDATSRVLALETGEVNYLAYQSLPSSAVPVLSKNPEFAITNKGFESLGTILMLTLNLDIPQLQDVRVRKALYMAIDRNYIYEHADYGLGKPADSTFPDSSWAYEPNITKYPYNPEAAAALLDEAGFRAGPDGKRMTLRLTCDANVELNRKAGEIVKFYLEEIGVMVDYAPVERGVMLDRVYVNRNFDMQIHAFSTGADPAIDVARLYISSNIRPVTFSNGAGYANPAVDALFEKGENTSIPEERAVYYREIQRILCEDLPVLWLVESGLVGVYDTRFENIHAWSAYSYYIFWDVWSNAGQLK